ncbi:MAG TPA: type II secretion system protein GspM [Bordetella sp.]
MNLSETLLPAWRGLRARYATLHAQVTAWLQQLTLRERQLVIGLAVLVPAVLVWLLLVQPALDTVGQLQAELPKLRSQAAVVADLAARSGGLQRHAARMANAAPTIADLQSSLQQSGLPAAQWSLQATSADAAKPQWTLKLDQAQALVLLRWLDDVSRDLRLTVASVELDRALDADKRRLPGRVDGVVTLEPTAPRAK